MQEESKQKNGAQKISKQNKQNYFVYYKKKNDEFEKQVPQNTIRNNTSPPKQAPPKQASKNSSKLAQWAPSSRKQSSNSNAERKSSSVSYVANYTKKSNIIKYEKQQMLEVFYNVKHPTPADMIEYQINYREYFSSKAIEPVNITDPQFQPDQCMIVNIKPVQEQRPQKEYEQKDYGNKFHKNNNLQQLKEYQEKPEQEPEWMDDDDDTYQDMKLEDFAFATQQLDFKSKLIQKPKQIDFNFNDGFDHIDEMLEKQFGNISNNQVQQDDLDEDNSDQLNQIVDDQSQDDFFNDSENQLENFSSQNDGESDHSNIDDYFDKNKDSKDDNVILPIGSKPATNFGSISKVTQVQKQQSPLKQDDDEITFDKLYQSQNNQKVQKNIEQKLGLGQSGKNQLWENTEFVTTNIPKPQQFFQNIIPVQQQSSTLLNQYHSSNLQAFDMSFVEKQCQQLYAPSSEYNKMQLFIIFTKSITSLNIADRTWYYKDPQNVIQGPFSSVDMDIWNQDKYFMTTLEISWSQQTEFMTILQFRNNPVEIIKLAQKNNVNLNQSIKQQQKSFMDLNEFSFKKPQDLFNPEFDDKNAKNGVFNQIPQSLNQIGQINNLYGVGFNMNQMQMQNKNKQNLMNMQNIQQMFKQQLNFSNEYEKSDNQPANPNNVPTLQSFMNIPNIQNIPNLPNIQQIQKIPDMASLNKIQQDDFKFYQYNQTNNQTINQINNQSNYQQQSNNVLNQQSVKNKEKAPTTFDIKMMLGLNQEK